MGIMDMTNILFVLRDRGFRIALLAPCLLNFNTPVLGQASQGQVLSVASIRSKIQSTASTLAASDSITIKKPILEFDRKKKELQYYLGGIRTELLGLEPDDPYRVPFVRQIQGEALKKLFGRIIRQDNFWRPLLDRSDQLVLATIGDIENTANEAELRKKLDEREEQFSLLYGDLHRAIAKFAQSKGYTARRVGDRVIASDSFTVHVVRTPAGGRVQVLQLVRYVQCSIGKCGDRWPWRELVSENENMIGEYFYQADWGNGLKNEGTIDVRNSTTLTFMPRH